MSKNKKNKNIKNKENSLEIKTEKDVEMTSNKIDEQNITSFEEVTENSSNNLDEELEEQHKENLEEKQSSTSLPINKDEENGDTKLLNNITENEIYSNTFEETEVTEVSTTERVIYENMFYKYVGIQTLYSDGSTSYNRYIIAEIEGVRHKRKVPFEFKINEKGHIIYEKQTKDDIELILISDSLIFPTFITENYITRETKIELSI